MGVREMHRICNIGLRNGIYYAVNLEYRTGNSHTEQEYERMKIHNNMGNGHMEYRVWENGNGTDMSEIGVSPSLNEVFGDGGRSRLCSKHEWSPTVAIRDVDIGTQLHQVQQGLVNDGHPICGLCS